MGVDIMAVVSDGNGVGLLWGGGEVIVFIGGGGAASDVPRLGLLIYDCDSSGIPVFQYSEILIFR